MADVLTHSPQEAPSRVPDILRRTVPWVRVMSVVLFISGGLMFVGGLLFAVGVFAGRLGDRSGASGLPTLLVGVFYAAFGPFYLIPAVFLHRFASRAKAFVAAPRPDLLEAALDAQRSYWKFIGILIIVGCVLAIGLLVITAGVTFLWFRTAAR